MSKTMSMVLADNQPTVKNTDGQVEEMKTKDIHSPKKPFSLLQVMISWSISATVTV